MRQPSTTDECVSATSSHNTNMSSASDFLAPLSLMQHPAWMEHLALMEHPALMDHPALRPRKRRRGGPCGPWEFYKGCVDSVCIDDQPHVYVLRAELNCRTTKECSACSMPMPGQGTHDEHVNSIPEIPESCQEDCAICLAPMGTVASMWQLGCGHTFHRQCMTDWKKRTCPMCRTPRAKGTKSHPDIFVVQEVLEPEPEGSEDYPICVEC